jgi:hypothetical protein
MPRLIAVGTRRHRFRSSRPAAKTKRGGEKYQAHCLEILHWLHAECDITALEVSSG